MFLLNFLNFFIFFNFFLFFLEIPSGERLVFMYIVWVGLGWVDDTPCRGLNVLLCCHLPLLAN